MEAKITKGGVLLETAKLMGLSTPAELGNFYPACKTAAIEFAAEYAYRKANPESKMDIPSMVYEDVEKKFEQWISNEA